LYATQHGVAALTREGFRHLVLLAVLPGIASVLVLARWVKEPAPAADPARAAGSTPDAAGSTSKPAASKRDRGAGIASTPALGGAALGARFWVFLAIVFVFSLGNSSDAFLMLRAQSLGVSAFAAFLMVAGFSAVVAVSSTPGGALSDALGRKPVLVGGWLIYAAIYLGFAYASRGWHVAALYAGYGVYYGAFQGVSSALVADLVPAGRRGAAFGWFNAALGAAALPASLIAGWLWQHRGVPTPFLFGGGLALVAALMLAALPMPLRVTAQGRK
jgi:MFS family permease